MRRLAALTITVVLGWFVVLEWGSGPSGSTALALGMALLAVRTRQEEAHLAARFGAAWSAYAATTGRFLPRLRPADPPSVAVR